jgi:hypothetical protein
MSENEISDNFTNDTCMYGILKAKFFLICQSIFLSIFTLILNFDIQFKCAEVWISCQCQKSPPTYIGLDYVNW